MAEKVLLIIAPSLFQCHRTALEFGFTPPDIDNFRNVTRVIDLRGVRAGTPFITFGREHWGDTREGFDLDQAVTTLQRIGKLRIAQEDDLAAHRPFDGVPFRSQSGKSLASARDMLARHVEGRL
jgi:hypothetical protein